MPNTHPTHLQTLMSNLSEVYRLQQIHSKITEPGPGRKRDVEILHKSCIVLLVACWESFVEDLATEALEFLIANAADHTVFSVEVLERIASKYQGKKAWDLAGTGWKGALKGNLKEVLAKTTGALNTPKTEQVNILFAKTIGLNDISKQWHWKGRSIVVNEKALDNLVTLRGGIAHRVQATKSVSKRSAMDAGYFIGRLSVKCHNCVGSHLLNLTGKKPWDSYKYGSTS